MQTTPALFKEASLRTRPGTDAKEGELVKNLSSNAPLHAVDTKPAENELIELKPLVQKNTWDSVRMNFLNGSEWFQKFRNNFTPVLNYFCVSLNSLAAIGSSINSCPKPLAKFLNDKSELFARYSLPASYIWNGIEALMGNRLPEALIRFAPALGFFVLPFYNFNLVTGISSGLNNLIDLVTERLGGKQPSTSIMENSKAVLHESQILVKEFLTTLKPLNSSEGEKLIDQVATLGTIIGGAGGLVFAAKERNSLPAQIFGSLGNISGFALDLSMIVAKNLRKKVVGYSCGLASLGNIAMRFTDRKLAKILNHAAIAADTFGMTYWAQSSKEMNDVT